MTADPAVTETAVPEWATAQYPDLTEQYAEIAGWSDANLAGWYREARERVFIVPRRSVVPVVAEPLAPLPAPVLPLEATQAEKHRGPRWLQRMLRGAEPPAEEPPAGPPMDDTDIRKLPAKGRHAAPGERAPVRDQSPAASAPVWLPPSADEQEAPTLLPGAMPVVPLLTDEQIAAEAERQRLADEHAAAVQAQTHAAQIRNGVRAEDLADLARPGDGRTPDPIPPAPHESTVVVPAVTDLPEGEK